MYMGGLCCACQVRTGEQKLRVDVCGTHMAN